MSDTPPVQTGPDFATGDPATPEALAPSTRTVTLGGQSREVPAEIADAFQREINSRDGRHGAELQRMRQELEALRAQLTPAPEPEPAVVGAALPKKDLLLNDPEEWQRQQALYFEHRLAEGLTQVQQQALQREQQLVAEQQRQQAWRDTVARFYTDHPDLKGDEDIVDMVYQRSFTELRDLPVPEAMAKIAERSRDRIAKFRKGSAQTPVVESGRPRSATPSASNAPKDEPTAGGLSAQIIRMQARMRGDRVA